MPSLNNAAIMLNHAIPERYRESLLEEARRVERDVLAPRSLDHRLILLVGGAGYIGTVATAHLLSVGYRVRCLDALVYGNELAIYPFLGDTGYEFGECPAYC